MTGTAESAGSARSVLDELAGLARARAQLDRSSTAERVAEILREWIIEGKLLPGDRLSEGAIRTALGISRNSLREAFRLLSHERLVTHELNRGVFVRTLPVDELADLFRVRRLVELAALGRFGGVGAEAPDLSALRAAVADGVSAAARAEWPAAGTANMRFHQAIAALAGSRRIDEVMRQLLAELRLVFHAMGDPGEFHEPYVARNRKILALLDAGEFGPAREALTAYLDDSERQLAAAYRPEGPRSGS